MNSKYSNAYHHRAKTKKELGDLEGYEKDIKYAANLGHGDSNKILISEFK